MKEGVGQQMRPPRVCCFEQHRGKGGAIRTIHRTTVGNELMDHGHLPADQPEERIGPERYQYGTQEQLIMRVFFTDMHQLMLEDPLTRLG